MNFSSNIDLGNLLSMAGVILTLLALHKTNVADIAEIKTKVSAMWEDYIKSK